MTLLLFGVFGLSLVLTAALRQYALSRNLVDVPNQRSSHTVPTPRGGGVAIVVAAALGMAVLAWPFVDNLLAITLMAGGAALVAAVGFADDLAGVSPMVRLVCHAVGATMAVVAIGGTPTVTLFGIGVGALLGNVLAVLVIVWWINLTNFMDGIDGIAGAQTVTVALSMAVVAGGVGLSGAGGPWLVLAAAAAGFLCWNWPPARIFMGDAGSGFVGFAVAVLALRAGQQMPELFWAALIFSAVFVSDATMTLLRRVARREPITQAHRSHAYQHLAVMWSSHRLVTVLVVGVNSCVLFPLGWLTVHGAVTPEVGLLAAYVPLIIVGGWVTSRRSPHVRLLAEDR